MCVFWQKTIFYFFIGDTGEGVDVGEEDGEVGAESFDEVRFGGGRERGEGADQGVDVVEDLLLLEAEDFFVGETKETPVRGSVGVRVRESESESERFVYLSRTL
ncbi:hypothetical protein RJT34_26478 [Clitoria ternatea]|uniref:Uncharacterized protein n=1 Tax=Clitoria ternatea TaxID=43366 RepID=A0AAN9F6Q8_CLITE